MSDFTHLHIHSHYSLLDGLGKIDDLVARTKDLGMKAVAVTDHGAMYGMIEFIQTAQEAGIKPIVGMEAYLAPKGHTNKRGKVDANPRHLTILAQTNQGYKNLVKLSTISHLQGYYYKPRIDYELLEQYQEGLIILSGCLNGDISKAILEKRDEDAAQLIEWHMNIFGRDRFYLEVQDHPSLPEQNQLNEAMIRLSKKYNLGLVATADSHYIHPDDAEAQDVLICVQTGKVVQDKDRLCMLGEDFSLKSPAEVKEAWKDHPEAIDNTQKITEMCQVELEFGKNRLPRFPLPAGKTPDQALREMTLEGLRQRYGAALPSNAQERLDYELRVIGKTGYASYFLIVSDFVNEAKRRGILVGPGRGSAAGSLVSYLTNITNVDPLKYNLLFERFLNPERVSMPDIDLDFADDRRDEVIHYVRQKYGAEHVAQIITFGTMAARAAIRDAGRALAYPYSFCDRLAKAIPAFTNFEQALVHGSELRTIYDSDPQAKKLIDTAKKLEGVCRHASTHAAGVVITDEPITEYVPLQLSSTSDGEKDTVTQYAMGAVEALGLLKMDFLGLKNLTVIQKALDYIKQNHGVVIDIDNLPEGDEATYRLLQAGKTTGVFQLESSGMKRYLRELKPTEFEDIISIGALYRPGPMDSIPDFIAAKHGRKKITYLHPVLQPILEKTYGVIVTQEQVLQIAREFAGFTYAQADILRKAVGKKIKALLDEQRQKFTTGAIQTSGVSKQLANQVWDFIEPFARYGFNRCLTGNTHVYNPRTGARIKIKDLYKNPKQLKETFSLSKTYKIYQNEIVNVLYNGTKPVFELRTRTGRSIQATANHPFLTAHGWTLLEDITLGDRIAIPRILPEPTDSEDIETYKLAVLGYLLAEGNLCHPNSFYFYSKSDAEIADYCSYLKQFPNTTMTVDRSKPAASVYAKRIDISQPSAAVTWIESIGLMGKKATEKYFPEFVWRLSNNDLAILLSKLWQGDGCINAKRKDPQIFYASSSQQLTQELQELLLRFGVISTLHSKKFRYRNSLKLGYTLSVGRHTNIKRLLEVMLPHLVGKKRTTANLILQTHPILSGQIKQGGARGSKDIVPIALAQPLVREAALSQNISFVQAGATYGFSDRLFLFDKRKIGFLRETLGTIADAFQNQPLSDLAHSDVYWDEVVSIKPAGRARTYDLSMKHDHNFIANTMFVHNSHAACYAMIAYQTAYLKANYPAEFMAALLTCDEGNIDRQAIEVSEAISMNIPVLPPSINESDHDFTVVKDEHGKLAIRFGLNAIKNVGHNVVEAIVAERRERGPFKDLLDLFSRMNSKDFNRKSVESLARSGAFDAIAERNHVIEHSEALLEFNRALHRKFDAGQKNLFGAATAGPAPRLDLSPTTPATKNERLAWEKELLGLYISEHPLHEWSAQLADRVLPLQELPTMRDQSSVQIAGIASTIKKIVTKSQQSMIFVQMEDLSGKGEVVVFPKLYQQSVELWQEGALLIISGKCSEKEGEKKILADKVWKLDKDILAGLKSQKSSPTVSTESAHEIVIYVPASLGKEGLLSLKETLLACHNPEAGLPVYIVVPKNGQSIKMQTSFKILRTEATISRLTQIVGLRAVRYI